MLNTSLTRFALIALLCVRLGSSLACAGTLAKKPLADMKQVFARQQTQTPAHWDGVTVTDPQVTEAFPATNWWMTYNDANLNTVVDHALQHNPNLQAVQQQIALATANAKIYGSVLFPKIGFNPSTSWSQVGRNQYLFPLPDRTFQSFQTPITVSYEVDFLGKNKRIAKSAKKQIDIARYQWDAARIQLVSAVATVYFNVAKWHHLQALAMQEVQTTQRLLKHSQGLLSLGQATVFDIQDRQQRLDQARINATQYANNLALANNQLLALTGSVPTAHTKPVVTPLAQLNLPQQLLSGVPSQLVLHRPDLAVAEAQLVAADLNLQVVRRGLFPSITLSGSTGYNSVGTRNLFNWTSLSTNAMAGLYQPIFEGKRLLGELDFRKVSYRQLLHQYEATLVTAFTEVENSLATLKADQSVYRQIEQQTNLATKKTAQTLKLHQAGLEAEPAWLVQQAQQLAYQQQLAQQLTLVFIDSLGVAKALGGGFQTP
jgi:outer membrane protein, multidrug efflux system